MQAYIVVATKGRAKEMLRLLDFLQRQTMQPTFVVISGTEENDLIGTHEHPLMAENHGKAFVSLRTGASSQRNTALEFLKVQGYFKAERGRYFCVFFDDDYRPHKDWLLLASDRLARGDIIGLTGKILADGVGKGGLTETEAEAYIGGDISPVKHWAHGATEREIDSGYGCNMAFIDTVVQQVKFDENLPFYSWQEDRDYTGVAKKFGRMIYYPECKGVHLGASNGRTNGIRFGYSQIANPLYLMKKGTMGYRAGIKQMVRNLLANILRSFTNSRPSIDYPGRLRGNVHAIWDVLCLRSDPRRIADDDF